eukprot:TRINITY_DN1874_c0_g5_i1.p1 TRINITY_DN1874_c0_g5~~TRINITY_DN1874_c0_g5_i1.p1  ORF type:complete len:355 (-),score=134.78 TRINITY_DN1874_c0_g5_i1:77-1141(-)
MSLRSISLFINSINESKNENKDLTIETFHFTESTPATQFERQIQITFNVVPVSIIFIQNSKTMKLPPDPSVLAKIIPETFNEPLQLISIQNNSTLNVKSVVSGEIVTSINATTEPELRVLLAAAYRLFDFYGWTDLIYNHITVRIPGTEHFLINPFGLLYSEISASSLIKIDCSGNIIDQGNTNLGVNRAGFVIHSAIHLARDDLNCVMHCHEPSITAIACTKSGFLHNLNQNAAIIGEVAYHEYEGIVVSLGERQRLKESLGDKNVLVLRNHGIVTCGNTVGAAFVLMWNVLRASQIQNRAIASGLDNLHFPSNESVISTKKIASEFNKEGVGQKEFCALLRMLDRIDSSYRL